MSDLLSIGASGVRAYQTALTTVGENIANMGVAGYQRRTATLAEINAGTGAQANARTGGNGVAITGITRSTDVYSAAALRASTADLSRTQAGATWLNRIEKATTGDQVSTRLTAFFTAATSLSAEPSSQALRASMIGAATSAAAAFTATGKAYDQMDADLDTNGNDTAAQLTELGNSLVQINDGLGRTQPGTTAAANLADQRDQILSQMSALSDIKATTDSIGRVSVTLGASGAPFVDSRGSGGIGYTRAANGTASFTVYYGGVARTLDSSGGATAGIVDGAQRVAAARSTLNGIATDFANGVNAMQAAGQDLNGNAGQPIFATGAKPTELSVVMTDGAGIAAASPGGGVRDASNLAKLDTLRSTKAIESRTTALITDNASAYQQKQTIIDAQTAIRDGAQAALSNSTGVNLDSEAVDLMRFQQAYSASSRVIQVARDTFQSILEIR